MSLFAIFATAALATGGQPVHTTQVEHRGETYRVDYRPHVQANVRSVGMSAGPRPSTQRCVMTAKVMVERVVAGSTGSHELKAMLPETTSITQNLPGDCRGRDAGTMLAGKADTISAHLARAATNDRPSALAAIDAAHHFAAN